MAGLIMAADVDIVVRILNSILLPTLLISLIDIMRCKLVDYWVAAEAMAWMVCDLLGVCF